MWWLAYQIHTHETVVEVTLTDVRHDVWVSRVRFGRSVSYCGRVGVMSETYESYGPLSFSTTVAGCGAAVFLFATVIASSEPAGAQSAAIDMSRHVGSVNGMRPPLPPDLPEIKGALLPGDDIAALEAIDVALTQASDGATYVWRHGNGRLSGAVRMTSTFRDADGRMCRHMEMLMASGTFSRKREGIACRQADGAWEIEG